MTNRIRITNRRVCEINRRFGICKFAIYHVDNYFSAQRSGSLIKRAQLSRTLSKTIFKNLCQQFDKVKRNEYRVRGAELISFEHVFIYESSWLFVEEILNFGVYYIFKYCFGQFEKHVDAPRVGKFSAFTGLAYPFRKIKLPRTILFTCVILYLS